MNREFRSNTLHSRSEIGFGSYLQLNIMSYDRRELSGQRSCHPSQVLDNKQETSNSISMIDGYICHRYIISVFVPHVLGKYFK